MKPRIAFPSKEDAERVCNRLGDAWRVINGYDMTSGLKGRWYVAHFNVAEKEWIFYTGE